VPEQHDCPLPCQAAYANVHKWTPYYSVDRLRRCELPVLLHFSVLLPLDDPDTDVLIRSCTIGADPASAGDRTVRKATSMTIENPKLGAGLFEPSASLAPAYAIDGREMSGTLALSASGGSGLSSGAGAQALLDGMKSFWSAKDNCDEGFLFAYDKQTVASVYIGAGIGKKTAVSALGALAGRLQAGGIPGNQTVAQICGGGRKPKTVFGIAIDASGDLAGVQKTAIAWSHGACADVGGSAQGTLPIKVFDIALAPLDGLNTTAHSNLTTTAATNRTLPSASRRAANP